MEEGGSSIHDIAESVKGSMENCFADMSMVFVVDVQLAEGGGPGGGVEGSADTCRESGNRYLPRVVNIKLQMATELLVFQNFGDIGEGCVRAM